MTLKFKCPGCQRVILGKPELSEKVVKCPCGQEMKMPFIDSPIVAEMVEPDLEEVDPYALAPLEGQRNSAGHDPLSFHDPLGAPGSSSLSAHERAAPVSPRSHSNRQQASDDDGGVAGFFIWIAVLLGINFLSYLFNWPFWIY